MRYRFPKVGADLRKPTRQPGISEHCETTCYGLVHHVTCDLTVSRRIFSGGDISTGLPHGTISHRPGRTGAGQAIVMTVYHSIRPILSSMRRPSTKSDKTSLPPFESSPLPKLSLFPPILQTRGYTDSRTGFCQIWYRASHYSTGDSTFITPPLLTL